MALEDTGAFSVFSTTLHGNSITTELASIERRVQNPPVGPISQADLLWDLWETLLRGLDQNFIRKRILVQYCLLPTNQVDDFIQGMEDKNRRFPCKYVTIRTKLAKEKKTFCVGITTLLDVKRYTFHIPLSSHYCIVHRIYVLGRNSIPSLNSVLLPGTIVSMDLKTTLQM